MSNTEAWTNTFPSGMKFHDGDRGSVAKLGGIPPIRLNPVCENTEEASFEKATVAIKFTDKARMILMSNLLAAALNKPFAT